LKICGHRGFDYYTEYRNGSVQELADSLSEQGFCVSIEPCHTWPLQKHWFPHVLLRVKTAAANLSTYSILMYTAFIGRNRDRWSFYCGNRDLHRAIPYGNRYVISFGALVFRNDKRLHNQCAGIRVKANSSSSPDNDSQAPSSLLPSHSGPSRSGSTKDARPSPKKQTGSVSPGSVVDKSTPATTLQPIGTDNFILLCFRVGKYLTIRHDLGTAGMTHDRPLFQALRDQYKQRARWLHRKCSLFTIQKMSMVQVRMILAINSSQQRLM
jgi:hypothetical protein